MKTYLSYVPHGVSPKLYFKIDELNKRYHDLEELRKVLFQGREYNFVLLFNSRNIRRKMIPDTIAAFKMFLDKLPDEQREKCCIILHTQPVDDNGTNLYAVREMLFGNKAEHHVIFSDKPLAPESMCLLYNLCDGVILMSSNEGWGLSLTEAMMSEKMIIANVTGGMQDQMRFTDENGKWISFTEAFQSNHIGKYTDHGDWALPVFPASLSYQGSTPTPYILDDRCNLADIANAIKTLYDIPAEEREVIGKLGREWVLSEESGMSVDKMAENFIKSVDHLFENWEPRDEYELIKIIPRKKKTVKYPISQ